MNIDVNYTLDMLQAFFESIIDIKDNEPTWTAPHESKDSMCFSLDVSRDIARRFLDWYTNEPIKDEKTGLIMNFADFLRTRK